MGIFDIFKSKRIDDEKFNSTQFQNEILAFALWKYNEKNGDYDKVRLELFNIREVDLTQKQIDIIIERLKSYNELEKAVPIKTGQSWIYKTRNGEENSRAFIFRIDDFNSEKIIHISVNNLNIKSLTNNGNLPKVGHIPISLDAFINSVVELDNQDDFTIPEIEEGYYEWKQSFDDGKAGVFSIEIKEIIDFIEKTINQ